VNYRVELRYLQDISPGWAVYFGEKILDIIIPLDPTEQKRDLQLFCIERQALGSE
jgi:head-tail adaptor